MNSEISVSVQIDFDFSNMTQPPEIHVSLLYHLTAGRKATLRIFGVERTGRKHEKSRMDTRSNENYCESAKSSSVRSLYKIADLNFGRSPSNERHRCAFLDLEHDQLAKHLARQRRAIG